MKTTFKLTPKLHSFPKINKIKMKKKELKKSLNTSCLDLTQLLHLQTALPLFYPPYVTLLSFVMDGAVCWRSFPRVDLEF